MSLLKRTRLWIRHYNRDQDPRRARDLAAEARSLSRQLVRRRLLPFARGLRSFAVDASGRRASRGAAKEMPKAELDEYLASGYGIFAGRKVEWATLKSRARGALGLDSELAPAAARSRRERRQLHARAPYSDDRELVRRS